MLNQIVLVGRLTKDPTLKELESGRKVTEISLAVPRCFKNMNGTYDTDYLKCILWEHIAENTTEYCKKGDLVGIKGRIQSRNIEIENTKLTMLEIIAEKVTFLTSKSKT